MVVTTVLGVSSYATGHMLAQRLLAQARDQGIDLVGPDGLLNRLTKNVLETALEAEMDEHLGYEKHDVSGSGNSRNGTRTKTVLTEIGPVEIDVPPDRLDIRSADCEKAAAPADRC